MQRDDQAGGAGSGDLLDGAARGGQGAPPPGGGVDGGGRGIPAPGSGVGSEQSIPAPGGGMDGGGQGAPAARPVETTVYSAGPASAGPASSGPASAGPTPSGTAPGGPGSAAQDAQDAEEARIARERVAPGSVRAEDTEPYIGLQYIARLFKIVSFLVLIALGLEMLLGIASDGARAILPLFAEIVQGGVLAAILWGAADVVLLLIDLGHDVRAERVLLGRISARGEQQYGGGQRKRERER